MLQTMLPLANTAMHLSHPNPPSRRARRDIGRRWRGLGRAGSVRQRERIDGGEQLPALGVLQPQLLGFFLDLLGFALDLLGFVPELLGFALDLRDLALERDHPPLVIGIASPVEHRQPQAPARQR